MAKINNLAYDLSVYEPLPQKQAEPKIRVKTNTAGKSISSIKCIVSAAAILFLLCSILYGKVEISKLYNDTTKLNAQLSAINVENTRMQSQIESKSSLKKVEDYAENVLGLQKLNKSQIEYVELQKENEIMVVKKENRNVFISIKNWVGDILEYIGI